MVCNGDVAAMSSPVSQDETTTYVTESDDVTRGQHAKKVKVKVKVAVKENDEDSENAETLRRCQPPWSRDAVFTRRQQPQRR